MWPFKEKNKDNDLSLLEGIMVDYLQFQGKKDQKWLDTVAALQSINDKNIMNSGKVDQWLKKSGVSEQTIDYIKFNKPSPEAAVYKKMDKKLLVTPDAGWIFQEVADHIDDLFRDQDDRVFGVERVLGAPQSIKNIHYLWLFSCEVGGGGLNGFIFNGSGSDLEWLLTLKALRAINAKEMVQRVESAIVLALQEKFIAGDHDLSNFSDLEINTKFDTFDKIEDDIYCLTSELLSKLAAEYIKKHKEDIFDL